MKTDLAITVDRVDRWCAAALLVLVVAPAMVVFGPAVAIACAVRCVRDTRTVLGGE